MEISELFNVEGKVYVVTGGSRGIGYMIAEGLVRNKAKVYITSRSLRDCQAACEKLNKISSQKSIISVEADSCVAFPADLSVDNEVEKFVKFMESSEPKGIYCLINNAGANWTEPLQDYNMAGVRKVMNINLIQLFNLTKQLIPLLEKSYLKTQRPSRIINIGSVHGNSLIEKGIGVPKIENYAYSASKAAVHHLTKHLARSLGTKNILVNAIAPGIFPSKMTKEFIESSKEIILKSSLIKRLGSQNDLVGLVIYLSSDASSFVTGNVIPVDGGALINSRL